MSGNAMRYIIGISFAALAIWALQATGILMAIAVFLMVGVVPGTSFSIPPTYMFILLVVLALLTAFWTIRQRPIKQIQELKQDYEKTNPLPANTTAHANQAKPREALYSAGFGSGFDATKSTAYRARSYVYTAIAQVVKNIVEFTSMLAKSLVRLTIATSKLSANIIRPLYKFTMVIAITTKVAAKELFIQLKPHLKRAATWLKVQAKYSLKGTSSVHSVRRIYRNVRSFLPKRNKNNPKT